jgi:hypothetical protein
LSGVVVWLAVHHAPLPGATPVEHNVAQLARAHDVPSCIRAAQVAIGGHALIARQLGTSAGPGLNGINAAFGAGSLLAPLMHSTLAPSLRGGGGAASYFAVAALLCAAAVPFVLNAAAGSSSNSKTDGGAAVRPSLDSSSGAAPPPASVRASVASAMRALGGVDGAALTASVMGLVACCVGAEACYGVWLYTYASQGLSLPPAVAAYSVSMFWASLTGGRLLAVAASSRMPPASILRVSLPLAVAGPVVALAFPGNPAALAGGVALAGVGLSCGFANAVALLARHVTPSGATQALVQLAACAGGLVRDRIAASHKTASPRHRTKHSLRVTGAPAPDALARLAGLRAAGGPAGARRRAGC